MKKIFSLAVFLFALGVYTNAQNTIRTPDAIARTSINLAEVTPDQLQAIAQRSNILQAGELSGDLSNAGLKNNDEMRQLRRNEQYWAEQVETLENGSVAYYRAAEMLHLVRTRMERIENK